jgi:hypothetical protein
MGVSSWRVGTVARRIGFREGLAEICQPLDEAQMNGNSASVQAESAAVHLVSGKSLPAEERD